ncbi:axoneme-associated protein mst101(2) [Lingula anatina]|uniref:Axoneme-associated protein mst101(2) n=1 Tax=Lingula anatina TaxID=7574 RepID=A0A1S3JIM0_LINAN|nr:axoneme-associated protein mst101(2) [Lingula anatina]|eukprot:XP_013410218.1 axoneme-associated protein mst101(2) [Lingula anatina]
MRKIKLKDNDFSLFDNDISPNEYEFFQKHKEAFRRMWIDQGKKFWLRFVITFQSFSVHYGVIKEFPGKQDNYHEFIEEAFRYITEHYCEGKANMARNLVLDVVVVAQHRHSLQFLESKSYAKDPFYNKDTRDVFRRLFGSPGDKTSYVKVYFLLPLYIKFGGSVCHCLRRWLDAPETDPMDDTYWTPPKSESNYYKYVGQKEKPQTEVDHGRLVPVKPKYGLHSCYFFPDDYDIDVECYVQERLNGAYNKPLFVLDWAHGDPRFYKDPENPLYDPTAQPGTDWRDRIMFPDYYYFREYVHRKFGPATNVDNLLAYDFNASRLSGKPEVRTAEQLLRNAAELERRRLFERIQHGQTYEDYKNKKILKEKEIMKEKEKIEKEEAAKRKAAKKEKKKQAKLAQESEKNKVPCVSSGDDTTLPKQDDKGGNSPISSNQIGEAPVRKDWSNPTPEEIRRFDAIAKDLFVTPENGEPYMVIVGQDPFSDEPDPSGPCAMKLSKKVNKETGVMEINVEKTTSSGTVNEKHVKYFNKETLQMYKPSEVPEEMKKKYGEPASESFRLRGDLDYKMVSQLQQLDLNIPQEKPHTAVFKTGPSKDEEDEKKYGRKKKQQSGGVNITMTFNTEDKTVNTPERKKAFTEAVSDLMKNNMQEPVDLPKALLNRVEQSTRREQARERLRKKQNQKQMKDLKDKIEDCKQKIAEEEREKASEKDSESKELEDEDVESQDLEQDASPDDEAVKMRKATLEAAEKVYKEEQKLRKKKKKERQKQRKKTKAEGQPAEGGDACGSSGQGSRVDDGQTAKDNDQSVEDSDSEEGSGSEAGGGVGGADQQVGEDGQGDGQKMGKKKKKKEKDEAVMTLDEDTKQELVSKILDKAEKEKEEGNVIQFIRHMTEAGQLLMTGKVDPNNPAEVVDYEAKYTDDPKPKLESTVGEKESKEVKEKEREVTSESSEVAEDASNVRSNSPRTSSPNSEEEKRKNARKECASCGNREQTAKTYKKCQKCKQENVKNARYYCGRECQVKDWKIKHKVEHKESLLE